MIKITPIGVINTRSKKRVTAFSICANNNILFKLYIPSNPNKKENEMDRKEESIKLNSEKQKDPLSV